MLLPTNQKPLNLISYSVLSFSLIQKKKIGKVKHGWDANATGEKLVLENAERDYFFFYFSYFMQEPFQVFCIRVADQLKHCSLHVG